VRVDIPCCARLLLDLPAARQRVTLATIRPPIERLAFYGICVNVRLRRASSSRKVRAGGRAAAIRLAGCLATRRIGNTGSRSAFTSDHGIHQVDELRFFHRMRGARNPPVRGVRQPTRTVV